MTFIEGNYTEEQMEEPESIADWMTRLSADPRVQTHWASMKRRQDIAEALFGWTRRVPLVGLLVWVFWSCLIEEGVYQTMKPRWGALTFSFLNDGARPTLWHTWRSIVDKGNVGIYPMGAPVSKAQAEEWERKWALERALVEHGDECITRCPFEPDECHVMHACPLCAAACDNWVLESSTFDPKTGAIKDRFIKEEA